VPSFPTALTNKQWQKNKGLFAKAKPTGIGEALTGMEKDFAGSGFSLDPAKLGAETLDPIQFEKRLDQFAKSLQAQANKIDASAAAVQIKITAAKATFAGNKSVLGVLGQLEADLANFRAAIKPNGQITTHVKAEVLAAYKKHLTTSAYWAQTVTKGLAASTESHRQSVIAEVRKLESDPRIAFIHQLWGSDGSARTLRTTPRLWDQVLVKNFPQVTAAIRPGSAMQAYNQLPWIDTVGNEPGSSATNKVTAMLQGSTDPQVERRAVTTMALQYSQSLIKYQDFCKDLLQLEKYLKKYA
jgi:hypothetical protein